MANAHGRKFEVLLVGAGPAGIAAAVCAAESGKTVGIVDDNLTPGGQIWRGSSEPAARSEEGKWLDRLRSAEVTTFLGYRIVDQIEHGTVIAEGIDDTLKLSYSQLILATGARERFLPFPGWTLPNVVGAGGMQALVKSGLPIRGKRVVIAGSGPLLLGVADYLRRHGAEIPIICEQTSRASWIRFGLGLIGQPAKILQALQLKKSLARIPFSTGAWPVEAHGKDAVESVTISRHGSLQTIACDYVACGFHLVPNIELASFLGCKIEGGFVRVDEFQQTTISGVFCAGEPTGIGGVECALLEGQIAGLAASGCVDKARALFAPRKRLNRFVGALEVAFSLRPELRDVPTPETLICRCEDISFSRLRPYRDWRSAKLQTRCGMGPCQGRVCGPATQFLFNWNPDSVRPPIFPARVESLATLTGSPEPALPFSTGGQ